MSLPIKLTTSDQPPVILTVSRDALLSGSRVFSDVLSIKPESQGTDQSIAVVETENDLKAFLLLIEGKGEQAVLVLEKYRDGQWENLARLGVKYECPTILQAIEAKIWQIDTEQGSAALAFTLATLTGNLDLIKYTAKRAVLIKNLQSPDFHATQEWKDRLAAWRTVHHSQCFDKIQAMLDRVAVDRLSQPLCLDHACLRILNAAYQGLECDTWYQFDMFRTPPIAIDQMNCFEYELCSMHRTRFRRDVENLQASLLQWPEFPVRGITSEWMQENLRYT